MERYNRNGISVSTLRLGHVKCIRQEILHPNEQLDCSVRGTVRLGAFREQHTIPIHVHLEAYTTPIRWLDDNWESYVTGGVDGGVSLTTQAIGNDTGASAYMGIGSIINNTIWAVWPRNYLRVYNEYYKWPEDADATDPVAQTEFARYGLRAVNLPSLWTRWISHDGISDDDLHLDTVAGVGSREKFSLQALAEASARLRVEMSDEYFASDRYREFIESQWNAAGSHEADQVPFSVGMEAGVMGAKNLWATDESGLGAIAAIHEFEVAHDFGVVTCPEHCLLSYFLVVRALPVIEDQANPFATLTDLNYAELTANPALLASERPKEWKERQIVPIQNSATALGYAPAGHMWRLGWNDIGPDVANRNSFLTYDDTLLNAWKYHDDMDRAFRSTQLAHALYAFEFSQQSLSQVPLPGASIMSGASL